MTTTVEIAVSILGISRTKAYALANGEFPFRLVRRTAGCLAPIPALLELLTGGQ